MEFSGGRTLMFKCGLSDKMSHSPEGRSSGHTPQTSSFITPVPTVENILQCLWFPCFWQLCFCQSCRTEKKIVSRNKNKSFSCFVLSWIWMSVEIEASPAQFFKIVVQYPLTKRYTVYESVFWNDTRAFLAFIGHLEPWYFNHVFNLCKTPLVPIFVQIRPKMAKWEHNEVYY